MAEGQDDSQKTEDPTSKRLEEAFQKGQLASSREIGSFFILVAFTMLIFWVFPRILIRTKQFMAAFIQRPESMPMDTVNLGRILVEVLRESLHIMVIPIVMFVVASLAASMVQNRFVFTFEPVTPKLEKISPMKGLARLFSMRSVVEFLKGIIKITIVGVVATYSVAPFWQHVKQLPDSELFSTLVFTWEASKSMLIGICIAMFFISLFDYMYQRFEYIKSLRMSKQEIKDEYKQQEGDPIVKSRLRSIRMERARKRMMSAVPTADVVITNPTHFAVALKYEQAAMRAPKLVAKGQDNIALRIRELAEEHGIPVVENAPLARALYASAEMDEEIPFEHYKAVAEVIGYVYRMKGKIKRKAG